MTLTAQATSKVAILYSILLFHGSRNQIGRTIWVLLNLLDTLRALKHVYPNGRRVGVVTRRKRMRAALAGWIVLVAVRPISFAADTLLFWIPFYSSIKMLIVLGVSFWRLESCAFLFQALVVPFVRRYEHHIDLTLLLIGSTIAFFFHFLFELPWNTLVSLAKGSRPTLPATPTKARGRSPPPKHATQSSSRPRGPRALPSSPERPGQDPSPRHSTTSRITTARADQTSSAASKGKGRVKAAAQALESDEPPRATSTRVRGKRPDTRPSVSRPLSRPDPPPLLSAGPSSRPASRGDTYPVGTSSSRQAKTVRPADKQPVTDSPPSKSRIHAAEVREALRTLPPAPTHEPDGLAPASASTVPTTKRIAPSRPGATSASLPKRIVSGSRPPTTSARRIVSGEKRARADDDADEDAPGPSRPTKRVVSGPRAPTIQAPRRRVVSGEKRPRDIDDEPAASGPTRAPSTRRVTRSTNAKSTKSVSTTEPSSKRTGNTRASTSATAVAEEDSWRVKRRKSTKN